MKPDATLLWSGAAEVLFSFCAQPVKFGGDDANRLTCRGANHFIIYVMIVHGGTPARIRQGNTMSMKKNAFSFSVALALSVTAANAQDAKLGFVMPYSGWFQPIDQASINGAMLAVKTINAAGGVLGQQIEVLTFDNKSEPLLGADGATQVIAEGAKAIMVPSDFDFGAPGAYVAQQAGVIAFSGASDAKFGVEGIGNLAYSISTASDAQGRALAHWAKDEKGWNTAYVLLDNTISYTQSLCGSFTQEWTAIAGEDAVLGSDTFLNSDTSISAQLRRISALETAPDVIMLCTYAPGGPSAIRQMRAAGIDAPIMTGESMDGIYWMGTVPDLTDFYVLNYGAFGGDDVSGQVNDFTAAYTEEYGQAPDVSYGLRGYSIVQAWAKAVEAAGTFDPEAVAAKLDAFDDVDLAVGPTSFSPDLHIATTRPMTIVGAEDGKLVYVGKTAAPAAD